ncbi:hypothetical protein B0T21DRAFT_289783 [Apiosordaria backusii]|uniref:Uncharacterized protein n=1 Tax=Apiosordaria backusii TaxID=314023 RepID=A0AA40EHD9_9PEZI|nr:hypothetical protein B0T21DRAFT_289783 [Apiosordaria backusii]
MPTYLTHAFPLPRRLIRIFTVLHDLTPCSPEHLISPSSSHSFLTCLHNLYPFLPFISPPPEFPPSSPTTQFNLLQSQSYSPVKLLEPYNPEDLSSAFTPFAFIADYAVKINDVGDIAEVMKGYDDNQDENDWFERLRDELMKIGGAVVKPAEGAEGGIKPGRVGWYIVVNGDEERNFPGLGEEEEGDDSEGDGREYRLEEELLGKLNKGGEVGNNKGEQQRHK